MTRNRSRTSPFLMFTVVGCAATCVGAIVLARRFQLEGWIAYLIAVNAVTLILYAYDKAAAVGGGIVRVPEIVLHVGALVGGTPGAFAGQRLFRHKTIKRSFQAVFCIVFVVQVVVVGLIVWYG